MDLPGPSFVLHSSFNFCGRYVTASICNGNHLNFHSDYFDCISYLYTVVDLYCCIMGRTELVTKCLLFRRLHR